MNQELKNKFNDILQELNSIDITEVEKHQETLENMLTKTRTAINMLRDLSLIHI